MKIFTQNDEIICNFDNVSVIKRDGDAILMVLADGSTWSRDYSRSQPTGEWGAKQVMSMISEFLADPTQEFLNLP